MHNEEHTSLPHPGLLIRRSGPYMAASISIDTDLHHKHDDRAERDQTIDERERERDMEMVYYMRGSSHLWDQHTTPLWEALYLRYTYFPFFCNMIFGLVAPYVLFIVPLAFFTFYLQSPFSRFCFLMVNVITRSLVFLTMNVPLLFSLIDF